MKKFSTLLLEEAEVFLSKLDKRTIKKVLYNIELAEQNIDSRILKKLHGDIWEFKCLHLGYQIRMLAFWDKSYKNPTLIIATHGFIKKTKKTPLYEIERAIAIRNQYFNQKENGKQRN